jgi:hypothetical protein
MLNNRFDDIDRGDRAGWEKQFNFAEAVKEFQRHVGRFVEDMRVFLGCSLTHASTNNAKLALKLHRKLLFQVEKILCAGAMASCRVVISRRPRRRQPNS